MRVFLHCILFTRVRCWPIKYSLMTLYTNNQVKKQQKKIEMILQAKIIPYVFIDIASSEDDKYRMRELCGESVLPPRFVKDGQYLGVSGAGGR